MNEPIGLTNSTTLIHQLLNNRYYIEKAIGSGGMGQVFKAIDKKNDRIVAIKTLIEPDEENHRRFVREYAFLKMIEHPCLIEAFDMFYHNNQIYMVLEFFVGESLGDLIDTREEFSLAEKLAIAHKASRAVEVLNGGGILHRDIKPDNIMVNLEKGEVKVLDLGIGKDLSGSYGAVTLDQSILGTLPYMSPEQANGKFSKQSDIFSLGVTLYQLFLWGEHSPFYHTNAMTVLLKVGQDHPSKLYDKMVEKYSKAGQKLGTLEQNVFRQISDTIEKSMDKKPEKRWVSAKEMADTFADLQQKVLKVRRHRTSVKHKKILPAVAGVKQEVLDEFIKNTPHSIEKLSIRRRRYSKKKDLKKTIPMFVICILVVIGLISVFFIGGKTDAMISFEEQAINHFQESCRYYELRDYKKANSAIKQALALVKDNKRYLVQQVFIEFFLAKVRDEKVAQPVTGWLEDLENYDDGYSYEALGIIYAHGVGVERNASTAIKYFKMGAQKGNGKCFWFLGMDDKISSEQSEKLYRIAAKKNIHGAMVSLGHIALSKKNYQQAFDWFSKAAKLGNRDAMFLLGDMYEQGKGVAKDKEKALGLYKTACEKGNSEAMVRVSEFYTNKKDYFTARKYLQLAAKEGNLNAILRMGDFYYNGWGVEKNFYQAREYYEEAAKGNNAFACYKLAEMYREEKGRKTKMEEWIKVRKLYQNALKARIEEATFGLGEMFFSGKGGDLNYDKALEYFTRAMAIKHFAAKAMTYMGIIYVGKNKLNKSLELWMGAAKLKDGKAMFCLGRYYEQIGNKKLARDWYIRGIQNGNTESAESLKKMDKG